MTEEIVLWTSLCLGESDYGKIGYYLDFRTRPVGPDLNSTNMRESLLLSHGVTEESLKEFNTHELLQILAEVLPTS